MSIDSRTGVRIGLAFVVLGFLTHTRADPDLWGHIVFGRDTVAGGAVPTVDPYSFTADAPWVNHGWLGDVLIYLAFLTGNSAGLIVLRMAAVVGMLAGVWVALSRQHVDVRERDLLIVLAAIGTFGQTNHMRPQVFSLLAFCWMLVILKGSATPYSRAHLVIPLIFAAWGNLHGGWMVGGAVLALWTLLTVVRSEPLAGKALLVATGALALVATLVNPYGWHMWEFLWRTVGLSRADINDWQPVYRLEQSGHLVLWCVTSVAAAIALPRAWRSTESGMRSVAVVLLLAAASLQVSRLLAFYTLAVVILLGADLAGAVRTWRAPRPQTREVPPGRLARTIAALIAAVLIGGGAVASARNVGCVRMEPEGLPEPQVVELAREKQLRGRLAIWFDWGEYAMWYFGSTLPVSIDGRRETVFSQQVIDRHLLFYYRPSTRDAFLADFRPDYIWLPHRLPVVPRLIADGWVPLYYGPHSVFLTRHGEGAAVDRTPAVARCFPGP
jgi:hypothetical protein